MELKYDIYSIQNAVGTGEQCKYVRLKQYEPLTAKELEAKIQNRCSLTKGDVAAVLSELHDIAVEEFSQGRRFYIPEIGYFSLSVGLEMPEDNPDKKITGKEVQLTGINFQPEKMLVGVTYQFQSTDIVSNDDKGKTLTQAKSKGLSLSNNPDEGEDWDGCRDLNHKSANVQKIIKAYLDFLKNDLGYEGFRYDMVKVFSGTHVADYNDAVGIKYSVGEYWDSNEKIESWINTANKKSAAFDFQFRYNVRDAINGQNWILLKSSNNLMHDPNYRQYAVTFVENHDTQYRSAKEPLDPIKKDTLAANAYLLAMPGTPCIFQPHCCHIFAFLSSKNHCAFYATQITQ